MQLRGREIPFFVRVLRRPGAIAPSSLESLTIFCKLVRCIPGAIAMRRGWAGASRT